MKFKKFKIILFLVCIQSSFAQMQQFKLQQVKPTDGVFKKAQDVDLKYILELNPDKLLAHTSIKLVNCQLKQNSFKL